eukprot:jgi/Chrzof1/14192/Cz08g28240.t1
MMEFVYVDSGFNSLRVGWDRSSGRIGIIALNRPLKSNAFDGGMWSEFPKAVRVLGNKDSVRVIVLIGEGANFCGGLDLGYLQQTFLQHSNATADDDHEGGGGQTSSCPARLRHRVKGNITMMQDAFTALEQCRWPVIAALQGACVGAGVDLVTACDIRYCTEDAYFCVKEVDVAITADLGTLQRLPTIIGHGAAVDLALTARRVGGREAESLRLVSKCFSSRGDMMQHVYQTAHSLSSKSPLAVTGTKKILLHARDHSVPESLEYVSLWNSSFLLSEDMEVLLRSQAAKQAPKFSKL